MASTLNQIKPGCSCKVVNIGGNNILKNRLLCMGVTPGTVVEVVKVAPLGDPMELKIRNYNLSIRKKEASSIFVEDNAANTKNSGSEVI
ncbi:FeoA family protein [Methanimicrococcus blatticola]|uniref:Ferrous iron transport protein A n=1 Tax=Methanimicrococcus blatticola TaxID=91560 RepID=A0A484F6S6_9EURY|nr:FeoA family protein [Methanimicrococcus blatticola]MBZ3935021.1 ferrous iron transport protein A [Methanimicrococcus blatticola]MCC2508881.1 ferrous iron transport protein A [Methanimicrococcus blatticola]TDQ71092.1 ferrous iron transport protein A [Methanimicrococcus blatticola]